MSSRMYQTSTSPWGWRPTGAGAGASRSLPKAHERCRRQVSLVVVGDMGCGKTTLSVRFCSGTFLQVQNTVGYDFHVRTVAARDGRQVQVRIWDTAGQERHRALAPVLFRGVHGCMLVYDCTRAASFTHVPLWAETLLSMTRSPVPRVLVGNKTDVEGERQVALEEGAALARDLGAARFYETSAVDGANVEAAFLALVDAVLAANDAADAAKAATPNARQPARQADGPLRLQEEEEEPQAARRRSCAC